MNKYISRNLYISGFSFTQQNLRQILLRNDLFDFYYLKNPSITCRNYVNLKKKQSNFSLPEDFMHAILVRLKRKRQSSTRIYCI